MEKEKSNKGIIIVLSIVIIVLLGTIVYMFINGNFVGNKTIDKEIEDPSKKEENVTIEDSSLSKEENLSLNDTEVQKLYNYVKADIATEEYFASNDVISNKTMKNDIKLRIAFISNDTSQYKFDGSVENGNIYIAEPNIILNQINEIFGDDNGYNHVTEEVIILQIACNSLKYNPSRNVYELYVGNGCGDASNYTVNKKLVSAKKINDTLVLTEKMYVYARDYDDSAFNVYKDLAMKQMIASSVNTNLDDNQEYYDKGATITYTFKLSENNNYYFDNSKITY